MKKFTLQLKESDTTQEIVHTIETADGENYYTSLGRSLVTAQKELNSLLTEIVDKNTKTSEGKPIIYIKDDSELCLGIKI